MPDRARAAHQRRNDVEARHIHDRVDAASGAADPQFAGLHRDPGELRHDVRKFKQLIQRDDAAQRVILIHDATINLREQRIGAQQMVRSRFRLTVWITGDAQIDRAAAHMIER